MSSSTSTEAECAGSFLLGADLVARVGFGAMQLPRCGAPADAVAVLQRAVSLGVNHIDTAQFYGDNGFANGAIGEVLKTSPDLVIATKVGADPNPGGKITIRPAQRPDQLRASVEDNLRSLGVDRIAVVNLRRLDNGPGLAAQGDQIVDIDDQLAAMIAMRDEGKIGAIGLSAINLDNLQRALPAGIVCVQNAYSIVSRQFEHLLEICVGHQIAWVPFFPLGGGPYFAAWPKVTEQPEVIAIAAKLAVTPSQLGLAWLLAHQANVLLIPGTSSLSHLEENIASASIALDNDVLAQLDAIQVEGQVS